MAVSGAMTEPHTLVHKIADWAKKTPNQPALHSKVDGQWKSWTWSEHWQVLRNVAKGLMALGHEVGDAVAIVGANKPQWIQLEFGIQSARGVPAPIYPTNTPEQMGYIITNAGAKVGLVDGPELLEKFLAAESGGHCPKFEKLITFERLDHSDDRVMSFDQLVALGAAQDDGELEVRLGELTDDETCLLIYTSGTTGVPKGVMIDHGGQMSIGKAVLKTFPQFLDGEVPYRALSYLPLSHQAEQIMTNVMMITAGGEAHFCPNIDELKDYLVEVRPTIFLGVPRVWEKFEAALQAKLSAATGLKGKLATWARETELRSFKQQAANGEPVSSFSRKMANKLVISKVKEALGLDQLVVAVTGAAPIAISTQEFFAGLGICIYEAYGMTETSGVATISDYDKPVFGAVGRAFDGVEIRIADDGEVQLRGRIMTKGYLKLPEETKELYVDGDWLCTGDLGSLDAEGNLRITGRKKELLITAGGKNVGPVEMENHIKGIPGIGPVVVVGDRQPYLCALITLDSENLGAIAEAAGSSATTLEDLAADPKVEAYLTAQIETECNAKVARYQTIKKFKLLPVEFSVDGGELTPTMKLRRGPITEKYGSYIAGFYAGSTTNTQPTA